MSEKLLREIPLLNKQIFEVAPIGMAISGFDGVLVRVNQSFAKTIGYEQEELIGKSFESITHPDDLEENLKRNKMVVAGEIESHRMEKRFIHKEGRTLHAILKVSALKNVDDKSVLLLAQVLDISDKIDLMSSVEISARKFKEIFEDAAIPMAQSTNEGDIFNVNKAFIKLLEYSEDELIGMKISKLSHPKDQLSNIKKSEDLIASGSANYSMEKRYYTKSGKTIHTILKVSLIKGVPPEPQHLLGQIVDISAQKKYEKLLKKNLRKLKKVNMELDSFIYRASHDLRGPLATLKGLLSLMQLTKDDDIVNGMSISIQKLEHTILELVEFSENSQKSIAKEKINLRQIINESIEMLGYHPNFSKVEVSTIINSSLNIIGDIDRIKPIFHNLLLNAYTYIDKEKSENKIEIYSTVQNKTLLIELKDNGVGMSDEVLNRAPEMFYRGSELSSGSGLGLYLVKQIVRKLKGIVKLKSEEGIGTKVSIKLPL